MAQNRSVRAQQAATKAAWTPSLWGDYVPQFGGKATAKPKKGGFWGTVELLVNAMQETEKQQMMMQQIYHN